ncbi:ferritin family protein [Dendrosporobacter sp. 1207_IL3150]|uniref:ferritin family protein n=1 Tax=Dendrosporobacter sp. 1207_IL3150 TaxID=3084054 RepID=UPI002FDA8951
MNIFEYALKMELDGEKFYKDLAEKAMCKDLKVVLEGLAEDERRHYKIIQSAQSSNFNLSEEHRFLDTIQNVFANKQDFVLHNQEALIKLKYEQIDVYKGALLKEQESVELYKKLAGSLALPEEKAICEKLMQEEIKHTEILEDIIQMLNHVNDWVEAAEFNHKDNSY